MGITLGVEQQRLLEDAGASPITLDANQKFAFLGVSIQF
jgi:outer membrane scaffolding protein for murein synthesis (MipA/OmpV family)